MFVALVAQSNGVLETTDEVPQPGCVGNHGRLVQIVGEVEVLRGVVCDFVLPFPVHL